MGVELFMSYYKAWSVAIRGRPVTTVQQYNSTTVQQYNSTTVQQYNSTTVRAWK